MIVKEGRQMSGKKPISHRRLHCYLIALALLFAGTLFGMWRVLGHRTEQNAAIIQSTITTDLVNSISNRMTTEETLLTSSSTLDRTIQGDNIAPGTVGMQQLNPEVANSLQGVQVMSSGGLMTPQLVSTLRQLLGLPQDVLD